MDQIREYLKPYQIKDLFTDIRKNLDDKHAVEDKLTRAKTALEGLKSEIMAAPGFMPEKNLTIQEGKFLAMYPENYRLIASLERELKTIIDLAGQYRETRDEYRMYIDYFTATAQAE